ncbi:hypothetical protein DVY93_09720 [Psychrobacter sp. CCUG 69069]|nr:hypothetical protein [Psychrobacter sp. CCUG 69069]
MLLIQVKPLTPLSRSASISASGIPHRPKPPIASVRPSLTTSFNAASALLYTFERLMLISLQVYFFYSSLLIIIDLYFFKTLILATISCLSYC